MIFKSPRLVWSPASLSADSLIVWINSAMRFGGGGGGVSFTPSLLPRIDAGGRSSP